MRSKRACTWSPSSSIVTPPIFFGSPYVSRPPTVACSVVIGMNSAYSPSTLPCRARTPNQPGAEDRDAGAHVDGREPDPGQGLRRFQRRRQHGADRVDVGLPHDRHRGRPDLRGGRFDLAVALLFGWTGAVSNRHDRESSTAARVASRERGESCDRSRGRSRSSPAAPTASAWRWARQLRRARDVGHARRHPAGPARRRRSRGCARDGLDVAGCVTDVTKLASVEHLADETVRAFGARARGVQQRGHRPGWADDAVGVGGERLALVSRRQRARHRVGDQGVRARA